MNRQARASSRRLTSRVCITGSATAALRRLAHLEAGKALGDPARRGQSAEVGRVERRVPFGEVDHAHARVGREPAHRVEEIVRPPSRPAARPAPPGIASGRSRRCRSRPPAHRNARHGRARGRSRARFRRSRTSPMVMTRLPAATASSCIARLLAKLASPTWAMLAPGRPSSISARTGLPLLRPWSRSRMSKCASSVIRPTFSSGSPERRALPAGSPHCCRRPAASAHAPRRSPRPPRG